MIAIYVNHNLIQALYFQPWAHYYMHYIYSVPVNGNFSAETRFKKYWKLTEKLTKNR